MKCVKLFFRLSVSASDTYDPFFETLTQCDSLQELTIQECDPHSPQNPAVIEEVQVKVSEVIHNMKNLLSLVWEGNSTVSQ